MSGLEEHVTHESGRRKTVCTSAVLAHFGVDPSAYHYSGAWGDVERILRRHGYHVRSRLSRVGRGRSVGQVRTRLARLGDDPSTLYYVGVPGHAMVMAPDGRTVVDTAPRKRDRRKVHRVFAVWRKE